MNIKIEIIGIEGIPLIKKGDDISLIILEKLKQNNIELKKNDILVVAQKIISKSLGLIEDLRNIHPSNEAMEIFNKIKTKVKELKLPIKNPELIQLILNESKELLKAEHVLITETKHGFICANAGIDKSNIMGENYISLLPKDPDKEAKIIRDLIKQYTGKEIAVIISDSFGRPFRKGSIGVALGVAGIYPLLDKRGSNDLYGKELQTTLVAQVDNLASAAQLLMGETDEGIPVILIRGYNFELNKNASIKSILREKKYDLFIQKNENIIKNLLKNRRSYKSNYSNKEVDKNLIINCIKISNWAPRAHNRQLGKYIIIEKKTRKNLIDKMNFKLNEDLRGDNKSEDIIKKKINRTRNSFLEAPFLILLCLDSSELDNYPDITRNNNEFLLGVQSISTSAIYFLLALESKGLSACWYSAPLFAGESVQKTLNLPNNFKPMAFFTIGYAKKKMKPKPHKNIEDIIHIK